MNVRLALLVHYWHAKTGKSYKKIGREAHLSPSTVRNIELAGKVPKHSSLQELYCSLAGSRENFFSVKAEDLRDEEFIEELKYRAGCQKFSALMKWWLAYFDYSIYDFVEISGMGYEQANELTKGKVMPDAQTVRKICAALKIKTRLFFEDGLAGIKNE